MRTLDWIVDVLDAPDALPPKAAALAVWHVRTGVTPERHSLPGRAGRRA